MCTGAPNTQEPNVNPQHHCMTADRGSRDQEPLPELGRAAQPTRTDTTWCVWLCPPLPRKERNTQRSVPVATRPRHRYAIPALSLVAERWDRASRPAGGPHRPGRFGRRRVLVCRSTSRPAAASAVSLAMYRRRVLFSADSARLLALATSATVARPGPRARSR